MRPVAVVGVIVSRILARTSVLDGTSKGGKAVHLVEPSMVSAAVSRAKYRRFSHAI